MRSDFPLYTTDYISGVMSLRKPQKESLKILAEIVNSVQLRKDMNLNAALGAVHAMYPICSDFEREFLSLTFALATGVGKTRLMGAFIAYLYTQHNIRNFFVVAPNTTIYEKLKKDLSDNNSPKSSQTTITEKNPSPCLNRISIFLSITSTNLTRKRPT